MDIIDVTVKDKLVYHWVVSLKASWRGIIKEFPQHCFGD